MIKIIQFPKCGSQSLSSFVDTCRRSMKFEMRIVWAYNADDALELLIFFRAPDPAMLEQLLCSELSANGFLYLHNSEEVTALATLQDNMSTGLQHYSYLPMQNAAPSALSSAGLSVLLSSLLQSHGLLSVTVMADANGVQAAVSADVSQPHLVRHAFGDCLNVGPSKGESFFPAAVKLLAAITQLPAMSNNNGTLLTGYGHRQALVSPSASDVVIGPLVDDILGRKVVFTDENISSYTLVNGVSGWGKTSLVKSLIVQQYNKRGKPFLVLEPAKDEYRDLKQQVPDLQVIDDLSGCSFLIPPKDVPVHMWSDVVVSLIALAMSLPADASLKNFFRQAYELAATKELTPKFMISAFVHLTQKYQGGRNQDFITAGIHVLQNFFRFFNGQNYNSKELKPFPIGDILSKPTVINLGRVPSPDMKTCLLIFVVQHLQAHLMQQKSGGIISNMLILEEAHHILGKNIPEQLAEQVLSILRESRAQGLSTIISEQSPLALNDQAIAQAGNVISLRLTSRSDQETIASALLCQPEELNLLPKYHAELRLNQMIFPAKVRIDASNVL